MIVAGLDLSPTRSGWSVAGACRARWGVFDPPGRGGFRLDAARRYFGGMVSTLDVDFAVIEMYAVGSHTAHQHTIAEFGGVIRAELFRRGVPYFEIAPTTLKKYATGSGRAGKPDVVAAAGDELQAVIADHNAADARWLAQIGVDAHDPTWLIGRRPTYIVPPALVEYRIETLQKNPMPVSDHGTRSPNALAR